MGKPDNLKFDVIRKTMVATETNEIAKMMREIVKIQFMNVEDCDRFKQTVEQYFSNSGSKTE